MNKNLLKVYEKTTSIYDFNIKPMFWKIFYYNTLRKIYDPIIFGFLPKSAKNIGPKKQKKNKQCSKVISFFLTSKLPYTETKCEKSTNIFVLFAKKNIKATCLIIVVTN